MSNPNNVGQLHVLEIRDTPNGLRVIGQGCLADYRGNSFIQSWVPAWIRRYIPGEAKSDEEHQFMLEARVARDDYAQQLIKLAEQDWETKDSSEIATAMMSAITTYCSDKKVCRLFVFSDMQDTHAKQAISLDLARTTAAGRHRAEELIDEFMPRLASTEFEYTVWGYGRDENDSSRSAPEPVRRWFKKYWDGYFSRLTESTKHGAGGIYDIFRNSSK